MKTESSAAQPSDFSFAVLLTAVCGGAALYLWWHSGAYVYAVIGGVISLAVGFVAPQILNPAKRAWLFLGNLLGKVISPIVLAIMFFVIVTPFGFFMRVLGNDPLMRKFDNSLPSYWIERNPAGPSNDSFPDQF